MKLRTYGDAGPIVIVLHGGPAAAGEAAPIARGLSDQFRTFEPFQTGSGDAPLTISRHVEDLHELIQSIRSVRRPAIVGESWGAMLALAYASVYPEAMAALVLIGCGTFDKSARARMTETIEARKTGQLQAKFESLKDAYPNETERLLAEHKLTELIYEFDPMEESGPAEPTGPFDLRAHTETWNDMLRLQENGTYPGAFSSIRSPALMIHGEYDPHPGRIIYEGLRPYVAQLEYYELRNCGHSPWKEKQAKDEFFSLLLTWLGKHTKNGEDEI